ncbi:MAG: histidinol-phosphatase HisJ family protein [Syntrophomonadaceae bacterium]|nr:histidinol-phosphatase HisJ family protein [Syntrophomonadaceae bacterium]
MLDYHIHVAAHGEYKYTDEWVGDFLNHARLRKINEVGLLEHDEFLSMVDNALIERLAFNNPDLLVRRGLEVDYVPGREQDIKKMLAGQNLDYVIGSVHFIDGWGFDHPDNQDLFENKDIDRVYRDYFSLINQAVHSGLFDIIGHIDLVKIWGYRPIKKGIMHYVDPVLKSISRSDMVIEINSAGLRKPVGEIYPENEILKAMFALNIPITLGSDAHHPDQVGEGLEEACNAAKRAGYRYVSGFDRRQRYLTDF